MRATVLGGVCLLALALAAPAGAGDSELKDVYPQRDGSTPELREKYLRMDPVKARPPVRRHAMDMDLNNIAVLVDDGTLIVGGVTDSDAIAARFYASHGDDWDYININVASTFPNDVSPEGGFAFEQNISNAVQGINLAIFNNGAAVAPGVSRLKSLLNMNDLGEYSEDPNEKMPGFLNTFGGVDVLGQEAGHMVGTFTPANNADILGRANAHWSYFFQTYGSTLEGNEWVDNADGTFTTVVAGSHYSQLDNYLFGFLLPAQVTDPMFVITNPVPDLLANNGDSALPAAGVTVSGTRTDVTIGNVTAANGARIPDANSSQKVYTMAWILVIPAGTSVAPRDMEKIDEFRRQWEEWFSVETGGVGSMVSEITPTNVTADFEARVVAGAPGLTVTFDNDSFGSITGYLWDFGDGNTSTERLPTHTYAAAGSYTVSLTVQGTGGPVTATRTDYIRVGTETQHYLDDFETAQGWTTDPGDNATTGVWLRADPVGSFISSVYGNDTVSAIVQPEDDHTPAGTQCMVTGNAAPTDAIGVNDIDGGITTLVSPVIDLSAAIDPVLSFWHWFSNNAGATPGRDSLCVDVSDDGGTSWTNVAKFHSSHYFWREEQVRLSDFPALTLTATMQVRFRVGDEGGGSIVEAAVDDVRIFDVDTATDVADAGGSLARFALDRNRPNPFASATTIRYAVPNGGARVSLKVYDVAGRLVRTLVDGWADPGTHTVGWNGRDTVGRRVANGVYLYRLDTPQGALTRKMFYVR